MFNMLSENYIKRIQMLSGILSESAKDKIIKKVKLPEFVADWIIGKISKKYWRWFSNDFKNIILGRFSGAERDSFEKQMEEGNLSEELKDVIQKEIEKIEGEYTFIADWLHGRTGDLARELDVINFDKLTFEEALERSENWHHKISLIRSGKIEDEDGTVVMSFPDGYYWISLDKDFCEKEAKAMGHCGKASGVLYSLRKDKSPAVTADINSSGTVKQMRGPGNTKPKNKYHDYIFDFIMSPHINNFNYSSYRKDDNFYISDLYEDSKILDILREKPELIKGGSKFKDFSHEILNKISEKEPNYIPLSDLFISLDPINIEKQILSEKWWEETLKTKSLYNIFTLFEESGGLFYDIMKKVLLENKNIINFIFFYNFEDLDRNLKLLSDFLDVNSEKDLTKMFLQKDVLDVFLSNNQLNKYISTIIRDELFGDYGLKAALKLLKENSLKKQFIKETSQEDYDITIDIIKDSL